MKCFLILSLLILLLEGARCQISSVSPSVIELSMYFTNVTFNSDLTNRVLANYNTTRSGFFQALSNLGGTLDDVNFSDGGGCLKAGIKVRGWDPTQFFNVTEQIEAKGIIVNGVNWSTSLKGCTANHLFMLTLYIDQLVWSADYDNQTSAIYNNSKNAILNAFGNMKGNLRTLKFADNTGKCVKAFVEWEAQSDSGIFEVTNKLVTNGLSLSNQNYSVLTKPCSNMNATVSDNQCPVVTSNNCTSNVTQGCNSSNCDSGYNCCLNGCSNECQLVGYRLNIKGALLVNITWTNVIKNLLINSSDTMKSLKSLIQTALANLTTVKEIKIAGENYMNKTLLSLSLYLNDDPTNEKLYILEQKLFNLSLQLNNGTGNVLKASLGSQYISNDPSPCKDSMCNGVCKQYNDGQFFCSCDPGYYGSDCSVFDCRNATDLVPNTTVNHCKNNGTCSLISGAFKCSCPRGYYGDTCEVRLCDLMVNPCNGQGVCMNSLNDGKLCECNVGRGGLFCESATPDKNMTECEMRQRLMAYINSSLHDNSTTNFTMSVKDVLKALEMWKYKVLQCKANDTTGIQQYYSECTYDTATGQLLDCHCLSPDGSPNRNVFFGPMDCRGPSPLITSVDLYVLTGWPDEATQTEIKSKLSAFFQSNSAFITSFSIGGRPRCVALHMNLMVSHPGIVMPLISQLKHQGIDIEGDTKMITNVSCDVMSGATLLSFRLYVANLSWSDNFGNQSSNEYTNILQVLQGTFKGLSGSLRTLQLMKQTSCVEMFVEWDTPLVVNFFSIMENVTNGGLQINENKYDINKSPCTISTDISLLEIKLYLQQVPSNVTIEKANMSVSNTLKNIGNISQLLLFQKEGCIEVFAQLKNVINASQFLLAMDALRRNGLQVEGQNITVSDKLCVAEKPGLMNMTLYSSTLTWTDSYKNENTKEYQALRQIIMDQLDLLKDKVVFLNLTPSNGCISLMIVLNITNTDYGTLMSSINKTGLKYNNVSFSSINCSSQPYTFFAKLLWNITVDENYDTFVKSYNASTASFINQVNNKMKEAAIPGYLESMVLTISAVTVSTAARAKRQATVYTTVTIESHFSTEVPVASLFNLARSLQSNKIMNFTIVNITFGSSGACPTERCSNTSICVTLANGTMKCACGDMYYGNTCSTRNTTLVCSSDMNCNSDKEKCFRQVECTGNGIGNNCKKVECIAKEKTMPCDVKACTNGSAGLCDPCNGRGICYNRIIAKGNSPFSTGLNYYCECSSGFSGVSCQVNMTVCQQLPANFCSQGCIGDLQNGQLCQCPDLYGGVWCSRPARSLCEKRKALNEDVQGFISGSATFTSNYNVSYLRELFKNITLADVSNTSCTLDVCSKVTCQDGEKCVAMKVNCSDGSENCSIGRCKAVNKAGVCPNQDMASLNKLLSNGLESCPVGTCYDDSDCDDDKKCCGFCASQCVKPAVTYKCSDKKSMANAQKAVFDKVSKEIKNRTDVSSNLYKALQRLAAVQLLWIPTCKYDTYLYASLQCYSYINNTNASCFCVDPWGNQIPGSQANASDTNSCSMKPFSCPTLEAYEPSSSLEKCANDMSCSGADKCCDNGISKVCTGAVDESKLVTVVDKLLSDVCSAAVSFCPVNSNCSNTWKSSGQVCNCPTGKGGLFCDQNITSPLTECQKKSQAVSAVMDKLKNDSTAFIKMLTQVLSTFNDTTDVISIPDYKCLADGLYSPTQCVRYLNPYNALEIRASDCFCVDKNGAEILGSRISSSIALPFCGDNSICPMGNAFSDNNGKPKVCGNATTQCPNGYDCKISTYGQRFCCPNLESLSNICNLPADLGSASCTSGNSSRYFYNSTAKDCQPFNFKGCAGNSNNFMTLTDCNSRCKDGAIVHAGTCPSAKVNVAKGQCVDQCQKDEECSGPLKCCSLNCAKQCVPAVDESNQNLRCPFGNPRGQCSSNASCAGGLYCASTGYCCIQFNEGADLCAVPPPAVGPVCNLPTERYFFNATTQSCQKFLYSGCQPEFNNFNTLEDCCHSCNKKGRCKQGECPAIKFGSVISCRNECLADGDCPGKKICCFSGCGSTCVLPQASSVSNCAARQLAVKVNMNLNPNKDSNGCDVVHVPSCKSDGSWSKLQCQVSLGVCWCVTQQGNYVDSSITKGVPACSKISDAQLVTADIAQLDVASVNFSVCSGSSSPRCCPAALCHKPCPAYPNATCVVDPCGGCSLKYYDDSGNLVNCSQDLSSCQKEVQNLAASALESHISAMMSMSMSMDSTEMMAKSTTDLPPTEAMPVKCQLPVDPGQCKGFMPQWYYDVATSKCLMFIWGMCDGNENRFTSPEACYKTCNLTASPCTLLNCTSPSVCTLDVIDDCLMGMNITQPNCGGMATCKAPRDTTMVAGPFVPQCSSSGQYSDKQCFGDYCWCAAENGTYIGGLTNNVDQLDCTNMTTQQNKCSNGQPLNTCVRACNNKVCPGYPMARCVVDLCSDQCETKFVNNLGEIVKCQADECKAFSFNEEKQKNCTTATLCPNARSCPESICQEALKQNCSRNPCAICLTDPCTCMPYFVDALTKQNLTQSQCIYLSQGTCAVKSCNIKKDAEMARLSNLDEMTKLDVAPKCTARGRFEPKQCSGDSCQCVNAFGQVVNDTVSVNGTCQAIQEISQIQTTFTFAADFKRFKQENKLDAIKNEIKKRLLFLGIDPSTIKNISEPYEGSIKVNTTIQADNTTTDLALVYITILQGIYDFTITINNETISLVLENTTVQPQVTTPTEGPTDQKVESSGLSERDKIIIGCVVGIGGGLILIFIIVLCACCYCKKDSKNSSGFYDHIAAVDNTNYDKPPARMNQAYMDDEDDRYIKVKL